MDDEPIKVEISLDPDLFHIARAAGNISEFIEAAISIYIATENFSDYLFFNKHKIKRLRQERYLQEFAERLSNTDKG